MKELDKARRYEAVNPGIEIPVEQKAERFDRKDSLRRNGMPARGRRTIVGSVTFPKMWPGHRDYEAED